MILLQKYPNLKQNPQNQFHKFLRQKIATLTVTIIEIKIKSSVIVVREFTKKPIFDGST